MWQSQHDESRNTILDDNSIYDSNEKCLDWIFLFVVVVVNFPLSLLPLEKLSSNVLLLFSLYHFQWAKTVFIFRSIVDFFFRVTFALHEKYAKIKFTKIFLPFRNVSLNLNMTAKREKKKSTKLNIPLTGLKWNCPWFDRLL